MSFPTYVLSIFTATYVSNFQLFVLLFRIVDSLWDLSRVPMQLQREIQIVKDHMHNQVSEIF